MTTPAPAKYHPGPKYVLLLGSLAAVPAITTDIYLPSLPTVGAELGASSAAAQLTISGMLVGGAVGQLIIGPLSDRFGRRLPVLVGLVGHVLTSLLCMIAPSMTMLIALRVLQGFFNAAASVVAIAVIRDRFVGSDAARLLSRLMLVIGVAPLFAPAAGGAIASAWTWRGVFGVLAGIGLVLAVLVWRFMPETLPSERRRIAGPRGVARGYLELVRTKRFMALALIPGMAQAVIMSYVVGSTYVFQREHGLDSHQFALLFAINGIALVGGAQVNAYLVKRVAPLRVLRVAIIVQAVFGLLLVAVTASGLGGFALMCALLWLMLSIQGLIPGNASVLALNDYGHMAGTAAAFLGAMQAALGGLIAPVVGFVGGTGVAMVSVMTGSVLVAFMVLAMATPAYRRGGAWGAL
ncbi:multidrug effflux MFS transporter [Sanguibacter sp. A247]|uniref:multidrug effflux MFS transporter n=1 Tax=unclassified Sanguibacter TaxID=2645534 RepID=UPI003FD82122